MAEAYNLTRLLLIDATSGRGERTSQLVRYNSDMQLYRFSPIHDADELEAAIKYTHFSCYRLCKQSFDKYLPNAGNVGIFCHYDDEFKNLLKIRDELCVPTDNPDIKYFRLRTPLIIAGAEAVPETTYTHLYIRKPDIYRSQVGDIDFYVDEATYASLKQSIMSENSVTGARVFDRADLDMVELYHPDIDALGYISTDTMSQKVHIKLSDATKL